MPPALPVRHLECVFLLESQATRGNFKHERGGTLLTYQHARCIKGCCFSVILKRYS